MASKLDQKIAEVAIVIAERNPVTMTAKAKSVADLLTTKDLSKLPDRWYPAFSAKKAGSPDLSDSWVHLWFEAVAEILMQRRPEGLPHLFALMDRDDSTYHDHVLIRLLRTAAEGVEPKRILDHVQTRLTTLHQVKAYTAIREVVTWARVDPKPLELLTTMVGIEIPNSEGDTVGKYIERHQWEQTLLANQTNGSSTS